MSAFTTSLATGAQQLFGGLTDTDVSLLATEDHRLDLPNTRALYSFLRDLYYNETELYLPLGSEYEGIEGYRNVAHAVVEFYVAVLFPGSLQQAFPLEIEPDRRDRLTPAIERIWTMSNWAQRKQLYVRWSAMLGDGILQSAIRRRSNGEVDGAFVAIIDPATVTNFDTDERGFLTYIRLDIPRFRRLPSGDEEYLLTEEWNKYTGRFRRWSSPNNSPEMHVDDLDNKIDDEDMAAFGIDFVPFTHAKFMDDGFPRGLAASMAALLKSREASRMATELHTKLFRYNQPDLQVIGNQRNPDGYIYQAPPMAWEKPEEMEQDIAGYRRLARPPAGYELRAIDNRVNYDAHMAAIAAQMGHLQESDVPELAWYQRNDAGESGKALRVKLVPATSRGVEVRGNLEAEIIRSVQMAITLAQVQSPSVPGFSVDEIGTFEQGDFDFAFTERDIIPLTEDELLENMERRARIGEIYISMGVPQEYVHTEILQIPEEDAAAFPEQQTAEQAGGLALEAELEENPQAEPAADQLENALNRGL